MRHDASSPRQPGFMLFALSMRAAAGLKRNWINALAASVSFAAARTAAEAEPDSKYPDSKYPATQCQSVFEKSDDLVMAVALVIPRQRAVTGNMPSGELILITLWTKLYSPGHDGSHGSTMCCH